MSLCDFVEAADDDFDCIIRVEFAPGQPENTLLDAIHILDNVFRRGRAANRFEELIRLEVTLEICEFQLRYFTSEKRAGLGLPESGYADELCVWYLKYVLASLNHVRKLESNPFYLPDIAVILQEPEPFDADPLSQV